MAIKEYSTTYSGASPTQDPDPITSVQPDLDDETAIGAGDGDEARSSHIETLRDKLDALARLVGDSLNLPAGSVVDILDRDAANGDARQVRLRERASDPTNASDIGFVYAKEVAGATEFFFLDSAGNAVQLTSGGSVNVPGGSSPLTTKGDLYTRDASADARLPVGSNGQVLIADSSEATGLKWDDKPTASAGATIAPFLGDASSTVTISSATFADIPSGALPEQIFVVDVGGTYDLTATLVSLSSVTAGSQSTVEYRLLFDESNYNGFTEQVIGADPADPEEWRIFTSTATGPLTSWEYRTVLSEVTLDPGTHKCKIQAKVTSGNPRLASLEPFRVKGVLRSVSELSPASVKGDILTYDTGLARLPVGTDGQVLIADSSEPSGIRWSSADTAAPKMTWSTSTLVNIAAAPGEPSTVRKTLQDGIQRSFSGTITFDPSSGVTDGGLDTGTEASDTWYYLYLVPSTADSSVLAIRGSVTAPPTGPTGYTNWRYIGSVRNDSSGNIRQFAQSGTRFDSWPLVAAYAVVSDSPFTLAALDISAAVPITADRYSASVKIGASASGDVYIYWLSPTSSTKVYKQTQNQITTTGLTIQEIDVAIFTAQTIYHELERVAGSGNVGYIEHQIGGWNDPYIR